MRPTRAQHLRNRRAARLAWLLCGLAILDALGVVVLDYLDRSRIHSLNDAQPSGFVLGISFSILGAMIASRQPGNRIGWIFLLIGVLTPIQSLTLLYYERSLIAGGLPGSRWAAWINNWAVFPVFPTGLALFAFLLFPSGHLPSPRWRPVAWLAVAIGVFAMLLTALQPGRISPGNGLPRLENPIAVPALGSVANAASIVAYVGGMVLLAVVIGGLLLRGRRSPRPTERQQVKLLAYAATVTIVLVLVLTAVGGAGLSIGNTLWNLPIVLGFGVAVPVACGVAILRHGLYEIDRLISRTVSYALLTGTLVGVFAGLVLLTTGVLPITSSVGVAASTLTAAALFNPLRRRIQRLVDRRFNRARYDAEETVAAFSNRLRRAPDHTTVNDELLHAVEQALAPAHATIWIKPTP